MTYSYPRRITPEETQWLAESWEQEPRVHVCGRCRTPWGPSRIQCPNRTHQSSLPTEGA